MSDLVVDLPTNSKPRPARRATERPDIPLPGGKVARPRKRWAREKGICEKTAGRIVDNVYIANSAYVIEPDATLKLIKHGQRRGRRG